jgi:hypothetical protein
MEICLPSVARKKKTRKKKANDLLARNTVILLSAGVYFTRRSEKRKN